MIITVGAQQATEDKLCSSLTDFLQLCQLAE